MKIRFTITSVKKKAAQKGAGASLTNLHPAAGASPESELHLPRTMQVVQGLV